MRFDIIPNTWVLLDSQSTVSVFKNRKLLTNIRNSTSKLRVHTNGGTQLSTQMGYVRNFGNVWYNPHSLANILSMAEVRKVCRITMDTSVEAAMHVHRKDGTIMKFEEYRSGLYFFDTQQKQPNNSTSPDYFDYLFLNTVANNKLAYTRREIEGADRARALYRKLGHPSEEITKQTAQYYGWKITGTFKPCSNCQTAKSKQNSVMKETGTKSTIPGERIFIDTSSVRTKSFGGSKFWLLVVDDCTDVAWSAFLRKKSDQVDRIVDLIKDLAKKHKTTVK